MEPIIFSEGYARVYNTLDKLDYFGFIDENGKEVIPLRYSYAEDFHDGVAMVREGQKFGYIDYKGNVVIDIQFDDATSFRNGKARVSKGGSFFYINTKGDWV